MSRFTVPIADILGTAFYNYELTSSTYNPTIDTSFTITCKVTNSFGNNVSGKSITLYKDGTSVSSATTNSSGVATWTVTLADWDNHHFNVETATLDLRADGWKQISVSTGNLWVNERTKLAMYTFSKTGTITSEISYANTIPSAYRPKSNVRMLAHNSSSVIRISIDSSGTVRVSGGTSSTSLTVACQLTYAFS
jgi:hypothetical protein